MTRPEQTRSIIRTSRYIAFLLRHKPESAGLMLDEHGWAQVDDLIACVSKRRFLDRPLLEEIVRTDNKGRYVFSEDGSRIRACQGHSVQVDVEPEEKVPPEYLWHGTADRFLEAILREGLRPQNRLYVHLSGNRETAVQVGSRHGNPVLLRIPAGQMHRAGYAFYQAQNGVWLTKAVPREYLERI